MTTNTFFVHLKQYSESKSETALIIQHFPLLSFPNAIKSEGLSIIRQNYLHKEIRGYLPDQFKDLVCPAPQPNQPNESKTKLMDNEINTQYTL